jgi:hypothetical protein
MSLRRTGFKPTTLRQRVHTAAHLGHWLESEGRALHELDEAALERFRDHLLTCTCERSRPGEHYHRRSALPDFSSTSARSVPWRLDLMCRIQARN